MSVDHKPEDEPEKTRIERAGGKITGDGRINGGLNLSRAIGKIFFGFNKTVLYESKYSSVDQVKFLKVCLPQILLGPLLNTLSHIYDELFTLCNLYCSKKAFKGCISSKLERNTFKN